MLPSDDESDRWARLAAWARFRTPSLRYTALVCCLTVCRDRFNAAPTCGLLNPETRCRRTSSSRSDNRAVVGTESFGNTRAPSATCFTAAGDRVGVICDNRPEAVWAWLGANAAQAIDVSFNAEARGRLLDYFVQDAGPRVLIGTEDYLQILADATAFDPEYVI